MDRVRAFFRKFKEPYTIVFFIILTIYTVLTIGMVCFAITTSFKDFYEFTDFPTDWPKKISFENYKYVWENLYYTNPTTREKIYVEGMLGNSLYYAIGCATVQVIVCSATAYVTSQFDFKFSGVVYGIVIFCMAFPVVGSLPSEMKIVQALNIDGSIPGMFILKANFLGMYYMVFFSMFRSIPKSYAESAKIDGASNATVMLRIYYPLCINTLFTVWLLYFVTYWNDYQTLLLYCKEHPTISFGLYLFKLHEEVPRILASSMLVFVPIFVVFLVFRKQLMGRLSMDGGEKG